MTFNILLAMALIICLTGLSWKAARWFAGGLTESDRGIPVGSRLGSAGRAVLKSLFGKNLWAVLKGVVLDGLFQIRLKRAGRTRWLAHLVIFWGFMPLLILHALDGIVTAKIFPSYESTLNPWLFLRDFFGLMVLAGLILAIRRRYTERRRVKASATATMALILVAAVVLSGFLVEGAKIASRSDFYRMVDEYGPPETEEIEALEALWVTEYGVAAAKPGLEYSPEQLELGREVNEFSCLDCHARPQSAFGGYTVSRLLSPFSRDKAGAGLVSFAYWLHVIICLGALAWLPFGGLRHVVTGLLSCIAERCRGAVPEASLRAVKRMLALDACTRCGLCSDNCSVGIAAQVLENPNILPSEKLASLGRGGAANGNGDLSSLLEGLTVCTDCLRCTGVCPVGIDLQDLWDAVREDLLSRGKMDVYALSPLGIHRSLVYADSFEASQELLEAFRSRTFAEARDREVHDAGLYGGLLGFAPDSGAFRLCFNCKTCTSSCPIVGLEDLNSLGLAPHQIIHATALGLDDLVASSRMLWACLGCYRCQDGCPQGVRVTDVLYAHKNKALARMKAPRLGKED